MTAAGASPPLRLTARLFPPHDVMQAYAAEMALDKQRLWGRPARREKRVDMMTLGVACPLGICSHANRVPFPSQQAFLEGRGLFFLANSWRERPPRIGEQVSKDDFTSSCRDWGSGPPACWWLGRPITQSSSRCYQG